MRRFTVLALVGVVALSGCIPFRHKKKPAVAPSPVLQNSPRVVDSLWSVGQRQFNRGGGGKLREMLTRLTAIMQPGDNRLPRLHFMMGEVEMSDGNELQAIREFRRVSDETPEDSLASDALLRAGDAYANLWKRPELDPTYGTTALGVYQEVVTRYPGTSAAKRASVRIRQLQDRFAFKEYQNALFYYKFKAYDSAILTLRNLVATYPNAPIVPSALEKLVLSYQSLGYKEDIKETCNYIGQFFPQPTGPRRLCPKEPTAAPKEPAPAQ
ncbi:MAG: outer membrane protein assembly factor BamD [Gemmatimonadota bacterium]